MKPFKVPNSEPIEYSDIDSVEPDVEGSVKVFFKSGVRRILTPPQSGRFLDWFNNEREKKAEGMDTQIESAIDILLKSAWNEDFQVGDKVWVYEPKGINKIPGKIIEIEGNQVTVDTEEGELTVSLDSIEWRGEG